jgi:hypothetical protein
MLWPYHFVLQVFSILSRPFSTAQGGKVLASAQVKCPLIRGDAITREAGELYLKGAANAELKGSITALEIRGTSTRSGPVQAPSMQPSGESLYNFMSISSVLPNLTPFMKPHAHHIYKGMEHAEVDMPLSGRFIAIPLSMRSCSRADGVSPWAENLIVGLPRCCVDGRYVGNDGPHGL